MSEPLLVACTTLLEISCRSSNVFVLQEVTALDFHPQHMIQASKTNNFVLQEVTALDFHPQHMILASGSKDHSIRFFEFSKPSVKKAYKSIQVILAINPF